MISSRRGFLAGLIAAPAVVTTVAAVPVPKSTPTVPVQAGGVATQIWEKTCWGIYRKNMPDDFRIPPGMYIADGIEFGESRVIENRTERYATIGELVGGEEKCE